MALSTSNPVTATSFNNTISGQVSRINKYHWDIKNKLDSLGLLVPSTITDSTQKDSNSKLVDTSHIETTFATLNQVELQTKSNVTSTTGALGAASSGKVTVTIPEGYYNETIAYDVNFSLSEGVYAGSGTISGSTVTVVRASEGYAPEQVAFTIGAGAYSTANATMASQSSATISRTTEGYAPASVTVNLPAGAYTTSNSGTNAVKISSGKAVITRSTTGYAPSSISATLPVTSKAPTLANNEGYINITPTAGYYNGSAIKSSYKWYTGAQSLSLNISTDSSGNYICTSGNLPAGYYSEAIITYTVSTLADSGASVFNVYKSSESTELDTQTGTISVPTNYDFQTARSYNVKNGSITAVTSEGPSSTSNEITFSGGVTTAGWISSDVTKPDTITLTKVSESTTAISSPTLTITPDPTDAKYIPAATWTLAGVKINPMSSGDQATYNLNAYNSSSNTKGVQITSGKAVITCTVAGYQDTGTISGTLPVTTTVPTLGTNEDSTPKLTLTPEAGYYANSALTTSVNYYSGTSKTSTPTTKSASGKTVTVSGSYSIPAGYYTGTNTVTYTGSASVGTVAYSAAAVGSATGGIEVTTAGWIEKGTYGGVTTGTATYATTDDDIDSSANTVVITSVKDTDGSSQSYMSQVTVDLTNIYEKLAAI